MFEYNQTFVVEWVNSFLGGIEEREKPYLRKLWMAESADHTVYTPLFYFKNLQNGESS